MCYFAVVKVYYTTATPVSSSLPSCAFLGLSSNHTLIYVCGDRGLCLELEHLKGRNPVGVRRVLVLPWGQAWRKSSRSVTNHTHSTHRVPSHVVVTILFLISISASFTLRDALLPDLLSIDIMFHHNRIIHPWAPLLLGTVPPHSALCAPKCNFDPPLCCYPQLGLKGKVALHWRRWQCIAHIWVRNSHIFHLLTFSPTSTWSRKLYIPYMNWHGTYHIHLTLTI